MTERATPVFIQQDETAELLTLKPRTLEKLRLTGEGPPFLKLGKRVVYDRDDVIAWARSRKRTSTSDTGAA